MKIREEEFGKTKETEPLVKKDSSAEKKSETSTVSQSEKLPFAKAKKGFKKRSFSRQYRVFRKSGLGVFDSFFNSFYIALNEKSVEREKARLKKNGEQEVPDGHFLEFHPTHLRFLSTFFSKVTSFASRLFSLGRKGDKGNVHRSKLVFLKSHLPQFGIACLGLFVFCYIAIALGFPVVLRAEVDGKVIGVVENKNVVDSAINELEDNVERILGESFHFPYEVQYHFNRQRADTLSQKSQISEQLYTYVLDSICTAGGLYVDDVLVAVCKDAQTVENTVDEFIAKYYKGDDSGIFNELRVVTQAYPTDSIITSDQLFRLMEEMARPLEDREKTPIPENSVETKPETEKDNAVPAMALVTDATYGKKEEVNSFSNRPQSIEKIKLDFYTSQILTYDTPIPFQTVYRESRSHYTTMADATVRGEEGKANVTAKIYYVNGKEVRRDILQETVLRQPVNRVISIGCKVLPEDLGIYSFTVTPFRFILPRVGPVSSGYGDRQDGLHRAWDIPGDIGDSIYASASGTVICAIGPNYVEANRDLQYFTSYGYTVIIDHGDGFSTLYAHCSDINVHVGQRVKQGEKIAEVGDTGNTTGSHVHFEVRINNVRQNPGNYFYIGKTTIYD